MSRISYFQRFSQRENHATNNTLLLLRYFYETSPIKLQRVITSWIDVPVELGLTFQQQVRREASVPDGLIQQAPLSIYFETKRSGTVWRDQIERHVAGIAPNDHASTTLLIGLTREAAGQAEENSLREYAKSKGVVYRGLTFSQIVEDLKATCAAHDEELLRIIDDYQEFLGQEGLLDEREQRIAVIPCGTSYQENLEFGLYYEPPDRPCRRGAAYLGVYQNKTVIAVGRVTSVGVFSFRATEIAGVEDEIGKVSTGEMERFRQCLAITDYYDLGRDDLRVYFVDHFERTTISKKTPGGIMGIRYLDLDALLPGQKTKMMTTQQVAAALNGKTFE